MVPERPPTPDETADESINRVLEAEQTARAAVERARADAATLLEQARLRARRINDRTDTRVSKLRAACQRWSAAKTAELQQAADEVRSRPVQQDERRQRLHDAVTRLAAVLTGGES